MEKKRILSGTRISGPLHIGNLHGALLNWKKLADEYDAHYFLADWHGLTGDYGETSALAGNTMDAAVNFLAAGLDPQKSVIFIQSWVPEHAELHLLLSMITPLSWLLSLASYKEQLREVKGKDLRTYGFLGYPVLQAADILMYRAHRVPVGIDQVPHVELTREIARRFNSTYGEVFPEPEPLLSEVPKVPGLDGRKMSKSYGNAIYLSDDPSTLRKKVATAVTDVERPRKSDPGHPENCNLYRYHVIYTPREQRRQIEDDCRSAAIGCYDCKMLCADNMLSFLKPVHEKRAELVSSPATVERILGDGSARARAAASETMRRVRELTRLARRI